MMTNIGKTKAEIIFDLVLSMNRGNSDRPLDRVLDASHQYDQLVSRGIIKEEKTYKDSGTLDGVYLVNNTRPPV